MAAGAAPGAALTFLMIGSATNFTENLNLYKMIGPRAMLLNLVQLIVYGMMLGMITNHLLAEDFVPMMNASSITGSIDMANRAMIVFPGWFEMICSAIVLFFAGRAFLHYVMGVLQR